MEYEVKIWETVVHSTRVEAKSREEAYEKAYRIITDGPSDEYDTEADGFTGDWDAYEA